MSFVVIIPARLASTRLPNKPLADLGGKPMVVRVAERARASGAARIVVATDHADILAACAAHGIEACMTRADHPSGTDRIAEVARTLGLPEDAVVVNLQGDEPLIDPALLSACAARIGADVPMATCAHPLHDAADAFNPTWSRSCSTSWVALCIFRAPPSPGTATPLRKAATNYRPAMCRCVTSVCMPTATLSCSSIRSLRLRRWRRSKRWNSCACSGMACQLPCT